MIIKGIQKTTLLDYPGRVACTIFTGGCNFRCPFCHNASLVVDPDFSDVISEDEVFSFLKKRKGILEGVCITGGEPLIHKDAFDFIYKVKSLGYPVKLDTNGSSPETLERLISEAVIDYIAMDIKNSKEKYELTAGTSLYTDSVYKSMDLIIKSSIKYEFRTTVVKELHTSTDLKSISEDIKGAERYFLQCFKDSGNLISSGYSAYSEDEMRSFLNIVRENVPNAELRGI